MPADRNHPTTHTGVKDIPLYSPSLLYQSYEIPPPSIQPQNEPYSNHINRHTPYIIPHMQTIAKANSERSLPRRTQVHSSVGSDRLISDSAQLSHSRKYAWHGPQEERTSQRDLSRTLESERLTPHNASAPVNPPSGYLNACTARVLASHGVVSIQPSTSSSSYPRTQSPFFPPVPQSDTMLLSRVPSNTSSDTIQRHSLRPQSLFPLLCQTAAKSHPESSVHRTSVTGMSPRCFNCYTYTTANNHTYTTSNRHFGQGDVPTVPFSSSSLINYADWHDPRTSSTVSHHKTHPGEAHTTDVIPGAIPSSNLSTSSNLTEKYADSHEPDSSTTESQQEPALCPPVDQTEGASTKDQ